MQMDCDGFMGSPEEGRLLYAERFGLPETSNWDEIYDAWKSKHKFWPWRGVVIIIRSVAVAAIPLLVINHWVAAVVSLLLFAVLFLVQVLIYAFVMEDEHYGLRGSAGGREIIDRAERDGIYV